MGINSESDVSADLVIGPTSEGMVRIYVTAEGVDLPMDFEPEAAIEIADELRAAAQMVQKDRQRKAGGQGGGGKAGGKPARKPR